MVDRVRRIRGCHWLLAATIGAVMPACVGDASDDASDDGGMMPGSESGTSADDGSMASSDSGSGGGSGGTSAGDEESSGPGVDEPPARTGATMLEFLEHATGLAASIVPSPQLTLLSGQHVSTDGTVDLTEGGPEDAFWTVRFKGSSQLINVRYDATAAEFPLVEVTECSLCSDPVVDTSVVPDSDVIAQQFVELGCGELQGTEDDELRVSASLVEPHGTVVFVGSAAGTWTSDATELGLDPGNCIPN